MFPQPMRFNPRLRDFQTQPDRESTQAPKAGRRQAARQKATIQSRRRDSKEGSLLWATLTICLGRFDVLALTFLHCVLVALDGFSPLLLVEALLLPLK